MVGVLSYTCTANRPGSRETSKDEYVDARGFTEALAYIAFQGIEGFRQGTPRAERRRRRIEMVEAKKAEEGRKAEKAQAEGEAMKISDADEVTTVNEPAEGTPAETDRPAVHFAVGASEAQAQPDFSVEVMPFKQKDPPIQIERSTPGKATEAVIHPPGSESTARKSTSPPAEALEPKAKKSKVATKSSPTKATRSKSPPPASNNSERRVTRASAKAAEADLSSDGATPTARKTRSKSPTKKTSTSATRSRRKATPDPLSTTSAPDTSKTKRKRASSPKSSPSPASPRKASGSSKDAGPDASPLPERRSKRARGAKAASKR